MGIAFDCQDVQPLKPTEPPMYSLSSPVTNGLNEAGKYTDTLLFTNPNVMMGTSGDTGKRTETIGMVDDIHDEEEYVVSGVINGFSGCDICVISKYCSDRNSRSSSYRWNTIDVCVLLESYSPSLHLLLLFY